MIEEYIDLSKKTTYKFGGKARYYLEYTNDTNQDILSKIKDVTSDLYYLGRGSNVAFSDKGYTGLVINAKNEKIKQLSDNMLEVSSGTQMPEISRFCEARGLTGAEFMIGIPGSIGGGVSMNAGAYERSVSDILDKVSTYDFIENKKRLYTKKDLEVGYRTLKGIGNEFIDTVNLVLEPSEKKQITLKHREYLQHRKKTQPSGLYNAGSVFKNPVGHYSGELIEQTGLKGYRIGTVSISKKHANFFVADKGAKAIDLYNLVNYVKEKVYNRFDILLENEIRFVGDFG